MHRQTHLGVYGVIIRHDALLLISKARGPYTGADDLPGGKIEFGESPVAALQREVREETGLCVQRAQLLDALSHRVRFHNEAGELIDLHHLGVLYRVTVAGDAALRAGGDGQDSHGAYWMPLAQIDPATLTPFAHSAFTRLHAIR